LDDVIPAVKMMLFASPRLFQLWKEADTCEPQRIARNSSQLHVIAAYGLQLHADEAMVHVQSLDINKCAHHKRHRCQGEPHYTKVTRERVKLGTLISYYFFILFRGFISWFHWGFVDKTWLRRWCFPLSAYTRLYRATVPNIDLCDSASCTPLYYAAEWGREDLVRRLLDHGADVNARGGDDGSALQAAAARDNEAVVRLLLDHGACVNAQGGHYGSVLQAAAFRGNEALFQLLLDYGADVNAQGGCHRSAL
jgi:hypothetical protein